MSGQMCQRWREGGRQAWRRPGDGLFQPKGWSVAAIAGDTTAKAFVEGRHYSGSYVAAVHRYGLFDPANALMGVAVLSSPSNKLVLTNVFPELRPYRESLELGRFVLTPEVAYNGESWFLTRAFRLAAKSGVAGVVSHSDPVPRYTAEGRLVKPGHQGIIYQATNAAYLGMTARTTDVLLPGGTVLGERTVQKIRGQERGHEYAERRLIELGARPRRAGERPADWLARALEDVGARRVRRPGKHRYAFCLGATRAARQDVRIGLCLSPYPKADRGQAAMFPDGLFDGRWRDG
jgi:hypothetical protein